MGKHVITKLMKAKTLTSDLRAEMQTVELDASKDRNEKTTALQDFILLQDKYTADVAERDTIISRIKRGQEKLESEAFAATNASSTKLTQRKKLQEQLDEVQFVLKQLQKTSAMEATALKGELELANKSINALQIQLENFYQDSGSKKLSYF